jgi:hypothetical protein
MNMDISYKEHFHSLENVGSKPFFVHRRYPTETGGITLAIRYFLQKEKSVERVLAVVGIAMCHTKDLYNRKLGAKIAMGRLEAMRNMYLVHDIDMDKFQLTYEVKDGVLWIHEPKEKAGIAFSDDGSARPHGILDELIEEVNDYLEEFVWPDIFTNEYNPVNSVYEEFALEGEVSALLGGVLGLHVVGADEDEDDEDDFGTEDAKTYVRRPPPNVH